MLEINNLIKNYFQIYITINSIRIVVYYSYLTIKLTINYMKVKLFLQLYNLLYIMY